METIITVVVVAAVAATVFLKTLIFARGVEREIKKEGIEVTRQGLAWIFTKEGEKILYISRVVTGEYSSPLPVNLAKLAKLRNSFAVCGVLFSE